MMNGWHLGSLKFLLDTQIPRYLTVHQFSRLVFFQLSSCMGCTGCMGDEYALHTCRWYYSFIASCTQSKYCCRSYAEDVALIFDSVQQSTPNTSIKIQSTASRLWLQTIWQFLWPSCSLLLQSASNNHLPKVANPFYAIFNVYHVNLPQFHKHQRTEGDIIVMSWACLRLGGKNAGLIRVGLIQSKAGRSG